VRALLLDAMGTLLALREPPAHVYVRIAARHGLAREREAVARALAGARIGPPALAGVPLAEVPAHEREGWRAIVRAALGAEAADGPCFDALFAHYATAEPWALAPDAAAALRAARARGLKLAVVSNMDARLTRILAALGLAAEIDAFALPSTCGFAKPDARIFRAALERIGVAPEAALYIGDREADCVAAARAAGLQALRLEPSAAPGTPGLLAGWRELDAALARIASASASG
jgi:putative hydrolase of the HAD superfamily